ncbi:hypothetical protein ACWFRB_18980 [Rhodococcus sp. NPDC055112]
MWSVPESRSPRTDWPASPPPPWQARVRAVLWWHRSTATAASHGPGGSTIPMTLAMMVDYLDSPVGPYREVLASPVLRTPGRGVGVLPAMAVPFIAVDSEPSVHGGRAHWQLPKVLARFGGDTHDACEAIGGGWRVHTVASPRGPSLPIVGALGFAQPTAGGAPAAASARLRGRFRYARVAVGAEGPTIGSWLMSGTHHGIVVTGRMVTGPVRGS